MQDLRAQPPVPPANAQVVYYLPADQAPADDEINLIDYWNVLVAYKWLIVVTAMITTAGAAGLAFVMKPVYRAEVVLAPVAEEQDSGLAGRASQFGGLASLAGINIGGGGGGQAQQAMATLRSRAFSDAFIKDEKLMPVLFSQRWDDAKQAWRTDAQGKPPTDWDAFRAFDSVRKITEDKKSGMTILSIEWRDPVAAAAWANRLVERINRHQKHEAIREAEQNIAYLKEQLRQTSLVEMQQVIYRLIEAQTKNIMLANVRDEFAFKVIDPAVAPQERIKPKRRLMVVLGGTVGLMLGVFLAFFLSFIKNQRQQSAAAVGTPPAV